MTPSSRMIVRVVALFAAVACLFPPWNEYNLGGHLVGDAGYAFITTPPHGSRLDIMRLGVELAVLLVIGASLFCTTKDDASIGVFSEETRLARGMWAGLVGFAKKYKYVLAGVLGLTVLVIAYGYYQNAETVRKSELATRIALEQAALVAQKQAAEEQHQQEQQARFQAMIDETRRALYKRRAWPVETLRRSGLVAHLESAQADPQWLTYKFSLTGKAAELETAPIYYSEFSATLLDSKGVEIGAISISVSDLVRAKNSDGGLVAMEAAGRTPMDEATYQSAARWSVGLSEK